MPELPEILVECTSCHGTGLYQGIAEKDGAAVICSHCEGTGARTLHYTPFAGRKQRKDIELVFSGGTGYVLAPFLVGAEWEAKVGKPVTYAEFLDGKLPTPPPKLPATTTSVILPTRLDS